MTHNMLSVEQVATRLDVHRKTVLRYIHEGRLKATRIGKAYRILPADLDAFAGLPLAPHSSPRARVTSIVEIPAFSTRESVRVVTTLQALLTSRGQSPDPMRLETAYDSEQQQLKLVLIGPPGEVGALLGFLDRLLEETA